MPYVRAFIAGVIFPSILLPFILSLAVAFKQSQVLTVPFLHFIPILWGLWNVIYFAGLRKFLPKDETLRLLLTGGILGLLVAFMAIFIFHIPEKIGIPEALHYVPLFLGPLLYAFFWWLAVKPLNSLLQLRS